MAIFVFRDGDALSPPEDIGLIIDGVEVLSELSSVASACAMLFGLIYTLNLSYPVELKYTFETFQKIVMDIESRQMSRRVQNLCVKLQEWVNIALWENLNWLNHSRQLLMEPLLMCSMDRIHVCCKNNICYSGSYTSQGQSLCVKLLWPCFLVL